MASDKEAQKRRELEEETNEADDSVRRPKVDRDELDEYQEWRKERGSRGRKRKDKAGGRHQRRRDDDEF